MKYLKFGSTGWLVSELGLGTYPFSINWGSLVEESEAKNIVEKALELGVNFIDTADVYGYGRAEKIIGKVLSDQVKREKIFLATKGGRDFTSRPGEVFKNFEVDYLRRALASSLERLRTGYVDLYWLHGPEKKVVEDGEVFQFLSQMKKEGKVRAVGVSLNLPDEARFIIEHGSVDAIGLPFNILSPYGIDEILKTCQKKGVAVVLREPLAQGLLTGKYDRAWVFGPDDFRSTKFDQDYRCRAEDVVGELNRLGGGKKSPTQLSLGYVLSFGSAGNVIFGVKSVSQVVKNLADVGSDLSLDEINQINLLRKKFVLG